MSVDVYPVGLLRELKMFWRSHVSLRRELPAIARWHSRRNMRNFWKVHVWRNIRMHRWHSLKNGFNGYLAEPTSFPEHVRRCGSGWTKRRALRSLKRYGYSGVE